MSTTLLSAELARVRDERRGLQDGLDRAEAECRRLRERLAITDRARVQALADLTAAEIHLDAAGLPIPGLPQPSAFNGTEWAQEVAMYMQALGGCFSFAAAHGQPPADARTFASTVDALIREWPARRERLLGGGDDG